MCEEGREENDERSERGERGLGEGCEASHAAPRTFVYIHSQ